MKLRQLLLSLLTLLGNIAAQAYDFAVDNIYYNITDTSTKTVEVTYLYKLEFQGNAYYGHIVIPESVTYDGTTYSVTGIGAYAFYLCRNLTSFTIPESVNYIGSNAFYATGWEENQPDGPIYIGKFLYNVRNGEYFEDITIEEGTIAICDGAFTSCPRLTSITLPSTLISIGNDAFSNTQLSTINLPESLKFIGDYAFPWSLSSITIPKNVESVGKVGITGLFSIKVDKSNPYYDSREDCNAIIETSTNTLIWGGYYTVIPSSVTSIGSNAFRPMSQSLNSVRIPSNITNIESYAFNCSLKSVTVESTTPLPIDSTAFPKRKSIILYVPVDCKEVYEAANSWNQFKEIREIDIDDPFIEFVDRCVKFELLNFDSNSDGELSESEAAAVTGFSGFKDNMDITSFDELRYFTGLTKIGDNMFYACRNLKSVTIPESVTTIGKEAFLGCNKLGSVNIPSSVTSIGERAFAGCPMTSITIPKGVTSIGYGTFSSCSNLTSITIPSSVTSIGMFAFERCSSLTSITIPNSVTSIGYSAFEGCSSLTSVKVDISSPISIYDGIFSNRRNATLYVPYGRKAAYQAASYWQDFKDIIEFIEGDVNSDYETDVVDVVDIARFVVGTPAETFVEILADINRDGGVNIGDAVALVNEIAGEQNFVKELYAPRRSATSANEDMLTLEETDNGIALVLMNQRDYTAFQFDLYVPEETDVAQMLLNSQRKQKHQLLYNKVEEGHYRVVALSTSNRTFMGNSGELLSFALNSVSDGDIAVRNILFYDVEGDGYTFDDLLYGGTATEIADTQSAIPTDGKYYTIDGRLIGDKPTTKGIYIVNGKKVMVK